MNRWSLTSLRTVICSLTFSSWYSCFRFQPIKQKKNIHFFSVEKIISFKLHTISIDPFHSSDHTLTDDFVLECSFCVAADLYLSLFTSPTTRLNKRQAAGKIQKNTKQHTMQKHVQFHIEFSALLSRSRQIFHRWLSHKLSGVQCNRSTNIVSNTMHIAFCVC